jgi:integrase
MSAGVRKNPRTGKWDIYFTAGKDESGKRKQVTRRGFKSLAEACKARTAAIASYHQGRHIDRSTLTVGEFLAQQWLQPSRLAPWPS